MKYSFTFIFSLVVLQAMPQGAFSGKVLSVSGEPLEGASVFIPNSAIGTTTNKNGVFILKNIPTEKFSLAISFVGYEVFSTTITREVMRNPFTATLNLKTSELESVVIKGKDKEGWDKWGAIFTEAFIGTSSFASNCNIINKEILQFIFIPQDNELRAFASEPIIVENISLGYHLTIDLVDFRYNLGKKEVEYQVYTLFKEMEGTEKRMRQWKNNRFKAYNFSLMHFMRSIYSNNFGNEGFELRVYENKVNQEKKRVQDIYKVKYVSIHDSLNKIQQRGTPIALLIDKSFSKDSLRYYSKVLEQDDKTDKLHQRLLNFTDMASRTESSSVKVHFDNYLVVTLKKQMEPVEYMAYKAGVNSDNTLSTIAINGTEKPQHPFTILYLAQGIPLEIYESGYFQNINLVLDGFWGWWEKIGTKLPYDYNPKEVKK